MASNDDGVCCSLSTSTRILCERYRNFFLQTDKRMMIAHVYMRHHKYRISNIDINLTFYISSCSPTGADIQMI